MNPHMAKLLNYVIYIPPSTAQVKNKEKEVEATPANPNGVVENSTVVEMNSIKPKNIKDCSGEKHVEKGPSPICIKVAAFVYMALLLGFVYYKITHEHSTQ